MTYSKLINIESKLLNINYNFQFSKPFIFRFISRENINGIKLKEEKVLNVNNTNVGINNWYRYNSNIDFSPLNKFKYLILQLYSEEYVNDTFTLSNNINDNFIVTNSNSWYKCIKPGPECGIRIFDQIIINDKPAQEVSSSLIYEIDGDAYLIKNKYLKAGKQDSIIKISGLEPNTINYIGKFELKAIDDKPEKKKNPIPINKYSDFIDDKIYPKISSKDKDIIHLDSRIEMIKFQLKNYFVENDKYLVEIEKDVKENEKSTASNLVKIEDNTRDLNSQALKIDDNVKEIGTINKSIININDELNKRIDELDEKFENSDLGTKNLLISEQKTELENRITNLKSIVKSDIDNLKQNVNDNTVKINNISNTTNLKLEDINELNKISFMKFQESDKKFSKQENINTTNELKFSEIKDLTEVLDKKINEKIIEKNSYIWSNNLQQLYEVDYHSSILNLNFLTESEKYVKFGFYLLVDRNNYSIPYFCSLIKEIDSLYSTARLVPITSFSRFS